MPYFKLDNDIFSLRLDPYEFQVYAYLVSCAGKKGECRPSTNTIARALGMSQSTVISKINSLVQRQLIDLGDHRALAHTENPRDGVGAWPALALLFDRNKFAA